jgi:hypothetical protein
MIGAAAILADGRGEILDLVVVEHFPRLIGSVSTWSTAISAASWLTEPRRPSPARGRRRPEGRWAPVDPDFIDSASGSVVGLVIGFEVR